MIQLYIYMYLFFFKKAMAPRSSILAWRIPVDRAWWAAVCGDAESDMAEQLTHTAYTDKLDFTEIKAFALQNTLRE